MRHQLQKKLHERLITVFTLAMVLAAGMSATTWANALYILTGAEDTAIILDGSQEVPDLSEKMLYVSSGNSGFDVTLIAGRTVIVRRDGSTTKLVSQKETISHLLSRAGITLSPLEMVAVDVSDPELVVTVSEDITYYDRVVETAAYQTVRTANPDLPQGTERVVQQGADGERTSIYEVVWANGEEVSRQFVESTESPAVDEIVEYGTAVSSVSTTDQLVEVQKNADGSGTLVFASGATMSFSGTKSMTATAYTGGHAGVGYTTASGTAVHVGTVAVDKSVIPLGTRMYIVTSDGIVYGTAVAEDTGVRGNTVDLYYDTYRECIQFGRRSCTVYLLK